MTMNLHDAVNNNGLFDLQGKAFAAVASLNTYSGATLPGLFDAIVTSFELATGYPLSFQSSIQSLPSALTSFQSAGQSLSSSVKAYAQNILAEMVADDTTLTQNTLYNQIAYLISAMTTASDYVTPNVVAGTLTAASNVGDVAVTWTLSNSSGVAEQYAYAETLTFAVSANPSAVTPNIAITGEVSVSTLDATWPQGSGAAKTISAVNPASSLCPNGNFSASSKADIPDYWIVAVGVPGTTVNLTDPEQQTVAISGTPTAGTYLLYWNDPNGNQWSTLPLAYNASASDVQTALRTIPGLSLVTVSSTGTTPNYTHTVTFTGVGGNIDQLTSVDLTTGGSHAIAHATTVAGVAGDYRGYTVELVGNSSVLHTLYVPISTLKPGKVYACHFRIRRTGTATSAAATVGIVQEIGGTVLNDPAGTANSLAVNLQTLSDSAFTSKWFTFRLPATALAPIYLRFACTAAIPTGASIFLADVAIAEMSQVYAGGPFVAAFSGKAPAIAGDSWTLAVTNTYAGDFLNYYNRFFGMAANEQFLPTTGTNLIDDSLIA